VGIITGTNGSNTLYGTLNDDIVFGLDGADTIYASQGHDLVDGGDDFYDRLIFDFSNSSLFSYVDGPRLYSLTAQRVFDSSGILDTGYGGFDVLELRILNDFDNVIDADAYPAGIGGPLEVVRMIVGNGDNRIVGSGIDDVVFLGRGHNDVDGGNGEDYVSFEFDRASGATLYLKRVGDAVVTSQGGVEGNLFRNIEHVQLGGGGDSRTPISIDAFNADVAIRFLNTVGDDRFVGSAAGDEFDNISANGSDTDRYSGGGGADTYLFEVVGSNLEFTSISDFDGDDQIHLIFSRPGFDFDTRFIGMAAFSGAGEEYRYFTFNGQTFIQFDGDGDRIADCSLSISNGAFVLTEIWLSYDQRKLVLADSQLIGGDAGRNRLTGTVGNDALNGRESDDVLHGGLGNDSLTGGTGDDLLLGGLGNDRLNGGAGTDAASYADASTGVAIDLAITGFQAMGTAGADILTGIENLIGSAFSDMLLGDAGGNRLDGGSSADNMAGGAGDDVYVVDDVGDLVIEVAVHGYDTVIASIDYVLGAEVERLFLSGVEATAGMGNAEANVLVGNAGANSLSGMDGDDVVEGGGGNDLLKGGGGLDMASYAGASAGVTVNLARTGAQNTVGAGTDVLDSFENIAGSAHADLLTGDAGANRLVGGAGDDVLEGGAGTDVLDGGDGIDRANYASAMAAVVADLAIGSVVEGTGRDTLMGIEQLAGSDYADSLTGDAGANMLLGGRGDDVVDGGAGNDLLDGGVGIDMISYATAAAAVVVNLAVTAAQNTRGGGSDTLAGFESLTGSAFNDILTGTSGNISNVIIGGNGDDLIDGGTGTGTDVMSGGAGIDTLTYENVAARVNVNLNLDTLQNTAGGGADSLSGFENLTGSAFNDVLAGTDEANRLIGGDGNDMLSGFAGNDQLWAREGDDVLVGGVGDDILDGGLGFDIASYATATAAVFVSLLLDRQDTGSAGTDHLISIEGLSGSAYDDALMGDARDNRLSGGLGNDSFSEDLGNDVVDGGPGIDTLDYSWVGAGVHVVLGYASAQDTVGAGIDTIRGIENVIGTVFNDILIGNEFANALTGSLGDDNLTGGLGNDVLDGGRGIDTVNYTAATSGVRMNLNLTTAQSTGGAGGDTLTDIENLNGSGFNDVFTGNGSDNMLVGNAGNDMLNGGLGNDLLSGGAGIDTASYAGVANGVAVNLALTAAQDTIGAGIDTLSSIENLTGSGFDDGLTGNTQANIITGGVGNDVLDGGAGSAADTLDGGAGNDTVRGQVGNDVLTGGSGNDLIDGGAGIDTVLYTVTSAGVTVNLSLTTAQNVGGGQGVDTLLGIENVLGSNFGDMLTGSTLANSFTGGGGKDTLTGGAGNDRFVYLATTDSAIGANADRVTDLTLGDILDLSGIDANANTAGINEAFTQVGSFSNSAGQFTLAFDSGGNMTTLLGDTNGDGSADFSVLFTGDVTALTANWVL